MFRDYGSWAKLAGEFVGSERAFAQKLEERFEQHRNQGKFPGARGRGFAGLALRGVTEELFAASSHHTPRASGGEASSYPDGDDPAAYEPDERS